MVVEERQGRANREAVQPQGHLGELNCHGVEVHTVHTTLEHVPLQKVDVGQTPGIDGDLLSFHLGDDRLAGVLKVPRYRVPWERPQEALARAKDPVAHKIDRLDQEVA